MSQNVKTPQQRVKNYFNSLESRLGYTLLLKGIKHFGYYPKGKENISFAIAQQYMEDNLANHLHLPKDSLILDAGCGEGHVASYLAQNYGFRIEGVDLLKGAIEKAKVKARALGLEERVHFRVGDYTKLSFSDQSFNGVYTMETLVHVKNYRKALRQFFRILKPLGKLALFEYSICSQECLTLRQKRVTKIIIEESGMHAFPHFRHEVFHKILKQIGFTDISVENITPRMLPMVRKFCKLAYIPYQIIKLLHLERKFVNAASAVEWYPLIVKNDFLRYNIITATKPQK